jgi:hypothetical protein
MSDEPPEQLENVADSLMPLWPKLWKLRATAREIVADSRKAYELAEEKGQGVPQARVIKDDIQGLYELIDDTMESLKQKIAEVETGSLG